MSWLTSLLGMGGGGIAAPIDAIRKTIDVIHTSEEEKATLELAFKTLAQHPHELQVEINKLEAQHRSPFVAGWRPFIGWVCGFGLSFVFIINPIIQWTSGEPGPEMPLEAMMSIVVAMLGLGGYRTFEKFKGLTK